MVPDSVPKDQKCNIKYYVSMNGPQEKVIGFKIKDPSLASLPPLSRLVSWKWFRESSEPNLGAPNIDMRERPNQGRPSGPTKVSVRCHSCMDTFPHCHAPLPPPHQRQPHSRGLFGKGVCGIDRSSAVNLIGGKTLLKMDNEWMNHSKEGGGGGMMMTSTKRLTVFHRIGI
jgi:hypothetical protein